MSKIGEGMQRALLKSLKAIGLRPDDIINMLSELDLDSFVIEAVDKIKEENNEEIIVIMGFKKGEEFHFNPVSLQKIEVLTESGQTENHLIIKKDYYFDFFGEQKESFRIIELIKKLMDIIFNNINKKKKKNSKK